MSTYSRYEQHQKAEKELNAERDALVKCMNTVSEVADRLLELCDASNWPDIAQSGDAYRAYSEITDAIHLVLFLLNAALTQTKQALEKGDK